MKISTLLSAYQESLAARDAEATQLAAKIARLKQANQVNPSERLATRLSLAEYHLSTIDSRHRAAASWITAVATPVFEITSKQLGKAYSGALTPAAPNRVSIRYSCNNEMGSVAGIKCLSILLTLAPIGGGSNTSTLLGVERSVQLFGSQTPVIEQLPSDASLQQLIAA